MKKVKKRKSCEQKIVFYLGFNNGRCNIAFITAHKNVVLPMQKKMRFLLTFFATLFFFDFFSLVWKLKNIFDERTIH